MKIQNLMRLVSGIAALVIIILSLTFRSGYESLTQTWFLCWVLGSFTTFLGALLLLVIDTSDDFHHDRFMYYMTYTILSIIPFVACICILGMFFVTHGNFSLQANSVAGMKLIFGSIMVIFKIAAEINTFVVYIRKYNFQITKA